MRWILVRWLCMNILNKLLWFLIINILFWLHKIMIIVNYAGLHMSGRIIILIQNIIKLFLIFNAWVERFRMWAFPCCLANLAVIIQLLIQIQFVLLIFFFFFHVFREFWGHTSLVVICILAFYLTAMLAILHLLIFFFIFYIDHLIVYTLVIL